MRVDRNWRWKVAGVALLASLGVWLGHTLEYLRVWGLAGIGRELTGSVHLYMLPLGLVLTGVLALCAVAARDLRARLARRAEGASRHLAAAWRTVPQPPTAAPARPQRRRSGLPAVLALGLVLTVLQVSLYVLQENLESAASGLPAPGLSTITGTHWAAPLIHAAVAFALAAAALGVRSRLRRREAAVERFERSVRGVLATLSVRRTRPAAARVPFVLHRVDCGDLLGASIWCRPPPVLVP